jgi:hypothetical protein
MACPITARTRDLAFLGSTGSVEWIADEQSEHRRLLAALLEQLTETRCPQLPHRRALRDLGRTPSSTEW